jgi:hypothetical protein
MERLLRAILITDTVAACATGADIKELGWSVDKRLSLVEVEVADLHSESADRAEVEKRFAEARDEYENEVERIDNKVEQRVEDLGGSISGMVGLPETIGIAIASMIATWLGRDYTRKRALVSTTRGGER